MKRVEIAMGTEGRVSTCAHAKRMEHARRCTRRATSRNARVWTPRTSSVREKRSGMVQVQARAAGRGLGRATSRAATWHGSCTRTKQTLACRSTASTPPPPLLDSTEAKPTARMRRLETLIALKQLYRDSLRAYVILQEELVRHTRPPARHLMHARRRKRKRLR